MIKTVSFGADRVKKARIQTLKADCETLGMKETKQLDDFLTRLNEIGTNIRAHGEKVEEAYVVKNCFEQSHKNSSKLFQHLNNLEIYMRCQLKRQ